MSWSNVRWALLERGDSCVACGSRNYRRSRRPPELVFRLLGLGTYRCRDCRQRFLLRRSLARPRPSPAQPGPPVSSARPGAA